MGSPNPTINHSKQERCFAQSACADRHQQADQQAVVNMGGGRTADVRSGLMGVGDDFNHHLSLKTSDV